MTAALAWNTARWASAASTTSRGGRAECGTLSSALTERPSLTAATISPISASASGSIRVSASCGQRAVISMPSPRAAPRSAVWSHSSSVRNGMTGCSSFRITSSAQAAVAWVSAFSASSAPLSSGLASSTYQSQKVFQMKR